MIYRSFSRVLNIEAFPACPFFGCEKVFYNRCKKCAASGATRPLSYATFQNSCPLGDNVHSQPSRNPLPLLFPIQPVLLVDRITLLLKAP